ncbi:hypothetical protein AB0L00_20805 [Actinoallomurus sp. NPDC052308]|uniref:hypothetical protein n=1 Tax=Actinoallomurus TaxID=667113 RepID=UPI0031EC8579
MAVTWRSARFRYRLIHRKSSLKIPRDLRQLARRAEAAGWTITLTSNNHLAWKPPSGRTVFCPSTPSDHRSVQNVIGKLRRAGLNTR